MTSSAVLQLPLTLLVLPWLMVPDTRIITGLLFVARLHKA
jgi:hypothetical protein